MKIVIDAFGGDNAPVEVIKGTINALKKHESLSVILCGDETKIKDILSDYKEKILNRIEIIHAPEIILNNESPTMAIKTKVNSSMVACFNKLKEDDDVVAMISAGSTGAVLTGGILKIGRISGVSRPALAPLLPTKKGTQVLLIDCGANVDCKPINLCHFALMGSEYVKALLGKKNPKIAILNIGTEDKKGNELCKETFDLLKKLPINFVGNMEARDLLSGDYDIVVSDGFAGNIALKASEGAISLVMNEIKTSVKKGFFSKIGAAFMIKTFSNMKKKFDYN
ncbi:MAG: phosphate acyltransferase PlsX, partial [Clostridia bacterium]